VTLDAFATAKIAELLAVTVLAIHRAATSPDEEAVHKMRVSIRRLQQALRLFRNFLREKGVRSLQGELKMIMEPAGELRNYDIALTLVRCGRVDAPEIRARRLGARQVLLQVLAGLAQPELGKRWSAELGVEWHEGLEA
jgi:CHAD domain-containing protein